MSPCLPESHSQVGKVRGVSRMCGQDRLTPVKLTQVPGAMRSCFFQAGKIKEGIGGRGFELDVEGCVAKIMGKGMTKVEKCFLGQCLVYVGWRQDTWGGGTP